MPRATSRLCNFCGARLSESSKIHLCGSCRLPFLLLTLKAESWAMGQIPLPFRTFGTARGRRARRREIPKHLSNAGRASHSHTSILARDLVAVFNRLAVFDAPASAPASVDVSDARVAQLDFGFRRVG